MIAKQAVVTTLSDINLSDHLPLSFIAEISASKTPPIKFTRERIIKKGLKMRDFERILLSPLWPKEPFIDIADYLGFTTTIVQK